MTPIAQITIFLWCAFVVTIAILAVLGFNS